MKDITLSIEDDIFDVVRRVAARRHTTVDAILKDFLSGIADDDARMRDARKGLIALMDESSGAMEPDYVWNREDVYADRLFPRHERPDLRSGGETQ